jgi:WD40 repeat protein
MIKKHKSTVLSLAWCCNNKFVVTGGCDQKVRVFSAFMAGIDPAEDDGFGEIWPNQHKFGEVLVEIDAPTTSWVQSVAWSANGFRIAFAEHASRIHFVQILAGSPPLVKTRNHKGLPFMNVSFLSDNTVCGVGFDNNPAIFSVNGGSDAEPEWGFQEQFEKAAGAGGKAAAAPAPAAAAGAGAARGGAFAASRAMFATATDKGQGLQTASKTTEATAAASLTHIAAVNTKHSNAITPVWPVITDAGVCTSVYTSGLDGRVILWDLAKLGIQIK